MKKITFKKLANFSSQNIREFLYFCDLRDGEIKPFEALYKESEFKILNFNMDFDYIEHFCTKELKSTEKLISTNYTVIFDETIFVPIINFIFMSNSDNLMAYHRYIFEKMDSPKIDKHIVTLLEKCSKQFVQNNETCKEENNMIPGINYYFSALIDRDIDIIKKYLKDGKIEDLGENEK